MSATKAIVSVIPPCDLHLKEKNTKVPAVYDAKTTRGPWAYLCEACFAVEGVGLGLGRGQRLILKGE